MLGVADVTVVSLSCCECSAANCAGVRFLEVFCRRLRALPRVATASVSLRALTGGYVVAARDQPEHVVVHLDEPVLSERLLLLPVLERLGDLLLEVARLDRIDDLQR